MKHLKLISRLSKIGIDIVLTSNYPWIYIIKVNDNVVEEKYQSEHGFTAFYGPTVYGQTEYKFSNRREVFKLIRRLL